MHPNKYINAIKIQMKTDNQSHNIKSLKHQKNGIQSISKRRKQVASIRC